MKDIFEIIRLKEQEIIKVRKEIEILKTAARILAEDEKGGVDLQPELGKVVEMP